MDLRTGMALAGLLTIPGVGAARAHALAEHFQTWDRLSTAADWELMQVLGKSAGKKIAEAVPNALPPVALPDGVRVISIYEDAYPTRLRSIKDAPLLIWCWGTPPPAEMPGIAIVGTREPTDFGSSVAALTARQAVEQGCAVISGLAIGIDSIASQAALQAGGTSWAWVGQGVDTIDSATPRGRLAQALVDSGGGVLSEVPPGTPYGPSHLLTTRNRLQSGSAVATLIAQTGVPAPQRTAGTMHTVRYTLQQGRLLAVARPPASLARETKSLGNMALTDPAGMDPAVVYATKPADIDMINKRRPVADLIVDGKDGLAALWNAIKHRPEPVGDEPAFLL